MACLASDLHRLTGIFAAPALLLLALTGFHLSNPGWLEALVDASGLGHGGGGAGVRSTATPNDRPVRLDQVALLARGPFPRAELRRITTPAGETGVYEVNLRQSHEINRRHPLTTVWVERWSGHIQGARSPSAFSTGQTFVSWIWPLHTGEAFGSWGRLLWFFAGFSLPLLYLSGLVRFLCRRGWLRDRNIDWACLMRYLRNLTEPFPAMGRGLLTRFLGFVRKGRRLPLLLEKMRLALLLWLRRMAAAIGER